MAYGDSFPNGQPAYNTIINIYDSDYIDADRAKAHYDSRFFTVEGNYWTHWSPRWYNYFSSSFAWGLRYIRFDEMFKTTFYKGSDTSYFYTDTKSNMYGLQAAIDLHIHPYHWLDWGIRLTGGVLASNLALESEVNDYNASVLLTRYTKHDIYYGFLGEIELFIQGRFFRRFYWDLGFDGILIHGGLQAPENVNFTTKDMDLMRNTSTIFQSWYAGLGVDF
jgi:hypothetical protein